MYVTLLNAYLLKDLKMLKLVGTKSEVKEDDAIFILMS